MLRARHDQYARSSDRPPSCAATAGSDQRGSCQPSACPELELLIGEVEVRPRPPYPETAPPHEAPHVASLMRATAHFLAVAGGLASSSPESSSSTASKSL